MVQRTAMTTHCLPHAYHCLLTAGLSRWIAPLMQLLHQYEGIERALEPDQWPLNYLGNQLESISVIPANERERCFFEAVASLPLLYYRVSGKGAFWHPGNETFRAFEKRMGAVSIWQEWTPLIPKQEIVRWLYANLPESNHARHTA